MHLFTHQLDWVSPRQALANLGTRRGTVLLESVRGGRYSILVERPLKVVQTLKALEKELAKLPKIKSTLPFTGGAVGFFAYELVHELESLPHSKKENLPRVWFGIYDGGLVWDHELRQLTVVGWSAKQVQELVKKIQNTKYKIQNKIPPPTTPKRQIRSNFTRAQYLAAIQKIKKLIGQGYTFQVNLSQKFFTQVKKIDLLQLYDKLSRVNPAPFAGLLDAGDFQILSSSPELLFRTDGREIETSPIAGTRPRGQTTIADRQLARELKASAKENAEHVMLVDLERNDLGRICEFGSIQVKKFACVEKYARVQHLVSHITGKLKPPLAPPYRVGNVGLHELLRALYPGGTITGCPKVETMKIINQLEPATRGAYTGSLGYISANSRMDFNILIRTFTVQNSELSWQAGGGIVADSDPAAEYEETLQKAQALFEAVLN